MYKQSRKEVRNIAAKLKGLKDIPVFSTLPKRKVLQTIKQHLAQKLIDAWINEKLDLFGASMRASSVLA